MVPVATLRTSDLIGRDAELEELTSRLGIRSSGPASARVLLLAGDAGVGKTRMLTELRDVALAEGWQVVAGHCLDLADGGLPYLPFSEILGRVAADHPDVAGRVIDRHPTLTRLLPGQRVRVERGGAAGDAVPTDVALDRGDVFSAVHDLIDEAAADAPLLMVVEDAHWADESTRDLLSFLFARPGARRVAVVVSYRSDDLHRRHPLRRQVAEWARVHGVERVQLDPLTDDAVRRLVRAIKDGTVTEREFVSIIDRAGGNPFFVEELIATSDAGEGPRQRPGGTSDELPGDLAEVLLVRLDMLDDTALQAVRLVSVAGRHVSHDLLSEVWGASPDELDRALRSAVDAHVLVAARGSSYAFRHALLGEAVYDDLLPGERTRLHQRFAEALDAGRAVGTAAELAQHARRSGDLATALRASVEAGDQAMAVGGASEAAAHFLDALGLASTWTEDGLDLSALARRCAGALVAAGRVSKAVKVLVARLDELGPDAPADERGALLTALASAQLLTDTRDRPLDTATEAVELLRDGSPRLLARALAVRAECLGTWRADESRAVALEALALAEQHDMTRLVVELGTVLAHLTTGGEADLRRAWEEAAARARTAGLVDAELRAHYFLGRLLHGAGQVEESVDLFRRVVVAGERAGMPWSPFVAEARVLQASALVHLGRLDEARSLLDVSGGEPPLVFEWLYFAHDLLIDVGLRGRPDHSVFVRLREHWSRDGLTAIIAGTAELALAGRSDDPAAAVRVYDDVVATVAPMWHEWFQARLRLATGVVGAYASAAPRMSTEERAAAATVVARMHHDGGRVIDFYAQYDASKGPEYRLWVARRTAEQLRWRWLAQVDAPSADEVVEAWRAAEAAAAAYGSVPELTLTRARLAVVLRAVGETAEAAEVAEQARLVADELGLAPVLDELRPVAPGRTPTAAGRGALTPRETEILALVAQGRTNGEVGAQLFIATKTVSVHVSNILGKLGATSRTEAAAIARREGLLG